MAPEERKRCALCGGNEAKITVEHIFGDWMADEFPEQTRDRDRGYHYRDLSTGKSVAKSWTENDFRHQTRVRVLCDPCNSDWGGTLESKVEPVLRPMLRANGTIVSPDKAAALSTWATKVAVLWEFLDPPEARIIPDWYRYSLREHTQPPPKTLVLAGSLMEGSWSHRTAQVNLVIGHRAVAAANAIGTGQAPTTRPENAFLSVLGFRRIFFLVVAALSDNHFEPFDFSQFGEQLFARLWPNPEPFFWPRFAPAPDQLLDRFVGNPDVFFRIPPGADVSGVPRLDLTSTPVPRQTPAPPPSRRRKRKRSKGR
jgi:hypothetical protein